jgi:hypothetical protein
MIKAKMGKACACTCRLVLIGGLMQYAVLVKALKMPGF